MSIEIDLEGRTSLVTGAARGIGRAIALRLAEAGCDVAVNDRMEDEDLREVGKGIQDRGRRAALLPEPVGTRGAAERLIRGTLDELGRLDVLVNNAGIFRHMPFLELEDDAFEDVMHVNVGGTFRLSQVVARHWVERGRTGCIINLSSISSVMAQPTQAHYAASKAGIELMSKVMAVELAPYGIRVNCLSPGGPILSDQVKGIAEADPEAFERRVRRRTPLGRVGDPDEVAGAAVFLASDDASYITGEAMVIDGGLTLNR